MYILGINAYHSDSSACIVADGKLVAAVEEERFNRIKHWAGLPVESVRYCLKEAGVDIADVEHIAINRNPKANILKKAVFAFSKRPSIKLVTDRINNASKVSDLKTALCKEFKIQNSKLKIEFHNVEHHVAHLASSFFVSPFEDAAVVSVDGFGDFVGAMWGVGRDNGIEVKHRTFFPHSLGLLYLAFTQYLGFMKYGDEYKVMGLAAYGEPEFLDKMRKVAVSEGIPNNGSPLFRLNLDYFLHHMGKVSMTWEKGEPKIEPVFSETLKQICGPSRKASEKISQRHMNIARSLQELYEELFFHILNTVYKSTGIKRLALAGGCAMNSLANGKIFEKTPFEEVYIQPAAGDAGGAVGAAYYVWNQLLSKSRSFVLESPYLGAEFNEYEISHELEVRERELGSCKIEKIEDTDILCRQTAKEIADAKVVGWFQGRMEWGPRALGNRSILCDPRRHDMKDILNSKIKRRESFRPFAPSILEEHTGEYFETSYPDPFMLKVYKIKPEKRDIIPAVTHVDGTGRLQTVSRDMNPLYRQLISEFNKITGIPVLLNTSFNENEPIVNTPKEALECFLRTKMDVIVMGKYVISRESESL